MLLTVLLLTITTNLFAFQNEPDGFRNMKWGTSIKDFKNIKMQKSEYGYKIYTKTNDELTIGGVPVKYIQYYFWNNKFDSVKIRVKNGDQNFTRILKVFKIKFGERGDYKPIGLREDDYWQNAWFGDVTGIWLEYYEKANYSEIKFFSRILLKEKLASDNKKEEKALQEKEYAEKKLAEKNAKKPL